MDGILVINKEKGFTSHDVVAKLRGILHMKKIGHTGTLDPDATGVLVVCLGKATKLVEFLTDKQKSYEAVLRLGVVTDTQDMTGHILETREVSVTREEAEAVADSFLGEQLQIPPMYSALKVDGKRLYELAREGQEVERKPRPVHFYEIDIQDFSLPLIRLNVTCSKGTYIRTLCHDMGQMLGCGASMEELVRTRCGNSTLKDSYTLAQVEKAAKEGRADELIISVEEILKDYPLVSCNAFGDRLLENGNPLGEKLISGEFHEGWVRMCTSLGEFKGIYTWNQSRRQYFPVKMF